MASSTYHHGDLKNALIRAGIEILSRDGVQGLSLRKAARIAGVSHAAPYAHFADKQALIAAISTEGHKRLHARVTSVLEAHPADPLRQLVEVAWAYVQFGLEEPAHFRVTFSGAVEKEHEYPALVEMTGRNFGMVRDLVRRCQAAGILATGEADLIALTVWGLVHGFVSLLQEGQVSHTLLDRHKRRELLILVLDQVTLPHLDPQDLAEAPAG